MNIFGRADDDRSLLHSSGKLDESIPDMPDSFRQGVDLDQNAKDVLQEFNQRCLDASASTDSSPVHSPGPKKLQSNDIDFFDDQRPNLEMFERSLSDLALPVEQEEAVSPRRGTREKLRRGAQLGSPTAAGEQPASPRKSFVKRGFPERFLGAVKTTDRSPRGGSKTNHIGEIKVNFAAVSGVQQNLNQVLEPKAEKDSPQKVKTVLAQFAKKSWKPKEDPQANAVTIDLNEKVEATVQKVQASELQHSFHQLNLGEMVPEVVCEAVKSKELVNDLKKRHKHLYMMNDNSSDDESTEVSESLDMVENREEELEREVIDIPMSKSAESDHDDFFDCIPMKHVEEETQTTTGAEFSSMFDASMFDASPQDDNETNEHTKLIKNRSEEYTTKDGKQNTSGEADVGRKSRRNNKKIHTEYEVRTWVRSSSIDQQTEKTAVESTSSRTVEPVFSPPSSPIAETNSMPSGTERKSRCRETEKEKSGDLEHTKTRGSPRSSRSSLYQTTIREELRDRKVKNKLRPNIKPGELNDAILDARFTEMKAVIDDFGRMDISDLLSRPDEHLKDVDLVMKEVPFTSYFNHLHDLEGGLNLDGMRIDAVAERLGVGSGNEIIESSPGTDGTSCRYHRLQEELEQSKIRLFLSSQEVIRMEREVEWLEHKLDEIKRS